MEWYKLLVANSLSSAVVSHLPVWEILSPDDQSESASIGSVVINDFWLIIAHLHCVEDFANYNYKRLRQTLGHGTSFIVNDSKVGLPLHD